MFELLYRVKARVTLLNLFNSDTPNTIRVFSNILAKVCECLQHTEDTDRQQGSGLFWMSAFCSVSCEIDCKQRDCHLFISLQGLDIDRLRGTLENLCKIIGIILRTQVLINI